MIEDSFLSLGPHGFHRIAYTEWGEVRDRPTVVCAHGLTRTGRDFDVLAQALADTYRVVCPDLPGRGRSHWLTVPADYQVRTYAFDMAALIARLGVDEVDWVGTSMGGMIGMALAAQPNTPIRKLVLNDVGPELPRSAVDRIRGYVGADPHFPDLDALEAYLRTVHAPFGPLTDAQWALLARNSARPDPQQGGLRLHYDPGIAESLKAFSEKDAEMWTLWDAISCPVLILRGAESDILSAAIAEKMLSRGPAAELVEFPGIGHAPALMDSVQIGVVRDWLLG